MFDNLFDEWWQREGEVRFASISKSDISDVWNEAQKATLREVVKDGDVVFKAMEICLTKPGFDMSYLLPVVGGVLAWWKELRQAVGDDIEMKAKDKLLIGAEILRQYPGTDPDTDIDWEMIEIAFKRGFDVGSGYGQDAAKAVGVK